MVCGFACVRKEKAKSACALILRFFHGYYPSEVARVLRTTRQAVDVRLLNARNEARLVLENPKALAFLEGGAFEAPQAKPAHETNDLLNELQQMIFSSRRGVCLTGQQLKGMYCGGRECSDLRSGISDLRSQPTQPQLAHIVSCPTCLDQVNRLLGIATLSQRHPADSVKRKPRGGSNGGGGDSSDGGGLAPSTLTRLQRSADEILEHRPQELCITVNGNFRRGSQYVTSGHSELSLVVDETIQFIEVLSEQDVRLLMLPVADLATGQGGQSLQVNLSDSRTLELYLEFRSRSSTLRVFYDDPTFDEVAQLTSGTLHEPGHSAQFATLQLLGERTQPDRLQRFRNWIKSLLSRPQFWSRPSTVTAVFALLLVAAIFTWRLPLSTTVSASELLSRSTVAEGQSNNAAGMVLHRTVRLEESTGADTSVLSSWRIEIWRSSESGITARRLFSEEGKLLAGEWRNADGSQTVYRTPEYRPDLLSTRVSGSWTVDDVWRWDLSASDFTALIGGGERAQVEETGEHYVVAYASASSGEANVLVGATLVLNRENLQAVEQTLIVGAGPARRQFLFRQSDYEKKPKDLVAPETFDPDSEFLKAGVIRVENSPMESTTKGKPDAAEVGEQPSNNVPGAVAPLSLEV
jgi:hypothetical protein